MFDIKVSQTREEIQKFASNNKLDLKLPEHYAYMLIYINNINFGNRSWGRNGSKEEQFYGILTQCVICDLFNQPRPNSSNTSIQKNDGGIDLVINSKKFDVKARSSNYDMQYMYVHNIMCSQIDMFDTDYYILCNFNKKRNVVQICGILRKKDFQMMQCFKHYAGEVLLNDVGKEIVVQQDIYCVPEYCVMDVWEPGDLHEILGTDDIKITKKLQERIKNWFYIQNNKNLFEFFKQESLKYSKNKVFKAS